MTAAAHRTSQCPFTLCYEGDAYSTDRKIMGRQSTGKSLMKAVARTWPRGLVRGIGAGKRLASAMFEQLRADGFSGELKWSSLPDMQTACEAGTLYYPSPMPACWAAARNLRGPAAFSLMGVTHTLASHGSTDLIANLVLPPFQPWDALICTSAAARTFVTRLHDDMRDYWRHGVGATRFVDLQLPVIPLGIDTSDFARPTGAREAARRALDLAPGDTAFLFAGRLAFHAKANPVPTYQALERVARDHAVVCVEAGIFPGDEMRQAWLEARQAVAPSVRFVWVDGHDQARYRQAWQAADVFVSLADNIQETFGLTPVEAMAAGLPVVVSDWNGYKDTVRDGVDGFRIPTVLPPAGVGADLALRHALGLHTYDLHVGHVSLATVVEPQALEAALRRLAADVPLRLAMGAAGRARAAAEFDWQVILPRYGELGAQLTEIRARAQALAGAAWPLRADPLHRFAHFASHTLGGDWLVRKRPDADARLSVLRSLTVASYTYAADESARESLLSVLAGDEPGTVDAVLAAAGHATAPGARALMWLWKFDLVEIRPPA